MRHLGIFRAFFCFVTLSGVLLGCGGGGGDSGLTNAHKLAIGDRWDFQRTTTTIQNGSSNTNTDTVRFEVGQRSFGGTNRLAINVSPAYTHAASIIISQDSFNNLASTLGVLAANGAQTEVNTTYLPSKLNANDTYSNLVVTPTALVIGDALVGAEESITTFKGTYRTRKVVTRNGGVTSTAWVRPGLGIAVRTVTVETGTNLTRTTEYILTATTVKG